MNTPRISASSYSNTAPLIWSFLYGTNHGKAEVILDNAPARSAELLAGDRVDAALVPVIAYQLLNGVNLIPNVCVGAKERVRSVCLITKGIDLEDVRSVSLDISSKTSAALTKILYREFLGFEPAWQNAAPDIEAMLTRSDAALLIGDPALALSEPRAAAAGSQYRTFDLAELWKQHTGFGFVFAMWMTRKAASPIDFAAARDEGLAHIPEIAANYETEIPIGRDNLLNYLTESISYSIDDSMQKGLDLYFDLCEKHGEIAGRRSLEFV
jgi:chorismate dehydratase